MLDESLTKYQDLFQLYSFLSCGIDVTFFLLITVALQSKDRSKTGIPGSNTVGTWVRATVSFVMLSCTNVSFTVGRLTIQGIHNEF